MPLRFSLHILGKMRCLSTIKHLVDRKNPFDTPIRAWLRDFKTFEPIAMKSVSSKIYGCFIRPDIIHRIVSWHLAKQRAGTACTKHRSDVKGSTRKIYQQKGTGRARAGSIRAPQRRGGATCFGPKPRSFKYTLPLKLRNLGLRSALSVKFAQGQLSFVSDDTIQIDSHKTAEAVKILCNFPSKKTTIIDIKPPSKYLTLATRSLGGRLTFLDATSQEINAYHILKGHYILLTQGANQYFENSLGLKP